MKIFKKIAVILIAIALSSCSASYMGITTGSASLSSNNFKTVRMATGTASARSILGIGGTKKEALVLDAKKDLLQNNPLSEKQALANVTVDLKNSFAFIVHTQKATVSADIVEFTEQISKKTGTKIPVNNQTDNKPVERKSVEKKTTGSNVVENKPDIEKPAGTKPDKISNTTQPTESVPTPETIKSEKAISKKTQDAPTPPAVPSFEPTITYSAPAEIATSSGERFKVEAGDYFIGTLNEKGNPENGKLYDKKGRPKHVILPRRNH
jgi:hypothetical protein